MNPVVIAPAVVAGHLGGVAGIVYAKGRFGLFKKADLDDPGFLLPCLLWPAVAIVAVPVFAVGGICLLGQKFIEWLYNKSLIHHANAASARERRPLCPLKH